MGSNKNDNTAFKDQQDFAADVLAEELQGVLKSVPEQNAHEFFNALKDEMSDEVAASAEREESSAQEQDFAAFDIIPEEVKASEESAVHDIFGERQVETEEAKAVEDLSSGAVDAAVDEIFSQSSGPFDTDEPTNPVRVFDDKTAAVQDFSEATAMTSEDKTQDLSSLENVASMEEAKAQAFQQIAKRNPSIDLKNADYIKFAQGKIKSLEKELSSLRIETQELALAGSHFKALADEREQRNKSLEAKISEMQSTSLEEKKILNAALEAKETKISLLQDRVEGLEVELESKYNRLRVRERELESRLEILKQEQDAVASSKDDLILRVKKQNNSLTADLERARAQSQKNSSLLQEKEDALRRTIKALKLSLTMLESQKQN